MRSFGSKISLTALLLAVVLAGPGVQAQQTTERFIPIGFSPGVSYLTSYIGSVDTVDSAARSVSLQVDGETRTLRVPSDTPIWLDRSKVRKSNIDGGFGDIRPGSVIEVKYDEEDPGSAVWVKVQAF